MRCEDRDRGLIGDLRCWNQVRSFGRKIKRKKAPVEALKDSPNSLGALLGDREIPADMDLREIWDRASQNSKQDPTKVILSILNSKEMNC